MIYYRPSLVFPVKTRALWNIAYSFHSFPPTNLRPCIRTVAAHCAAHLKHVRQSRSLPKRRARAILWKQFRPHVAMKRRMRPIADAGDQTVFDRIDVTIRDVAAEILIVADQVFPEPMLQVACSPHERSDMRDCQPNLYTRISLRSSGLLASIKQKLGA